MSSSLLPAAVRACAVFALASIAVVTSACEPVIDHDADVVAPPDVHVARDAAVVVRDADRAADVAPSALDAGTDPAQPPVDAALDAGAALQADAGASEAGAAPQLDAASVDAAAMRADAARSDAAAQAERSGDFAAGTRRIEVRASADRVLPVQLWYPALDTAASEASAGHGIADFEPPGARRELLEKLLAQAPEHCPNATMHAAIDAEPYARSAPFPLLVYSHHFDGTRFSMFTIAEALARAGMVVAAPDHVGASLFERKDTVTSALSQISGVFLDERVADLRRVLDEMLDPKAEAVPEGLRGRMDAARVGAIGHSLGGISVGAYSVADTRVRASAYLAIIPSPWLLTLLFGVPEPKQFRTPALYLSAAEDAVVETQGGMQELTANFEGQPLPAYWIDVADAGHFSFADDSGLIADFEEGCASMGQRLSNGEAFTFVDPKRAREIAAHYTTRFFAAEFLGASRAPLAQAEPAELVTIKQHGH
jgi:dienelactone hydrolase